MLIAVTDQRYRQRVRGTLDARGEIIARVGNAYGAGRVTPGPRRGNVDVRDGSLVFVCVEDKPRGELLVVTLWEEGEDPAVPRRFTDALERRR
jgi:hypothetical protein